MKCILVLLIGAASVLAQFTSIPTPVSGRSTTLTANGATDDVQINAAITALNATGGGTVLLNPGTFQLSAGQSIVAKSGVSIVAVQPSLTGFDSASNDYWTFGTIGTVIRGDGATDCIAANTTPAASPSGYASSGAIAYVTLSGFGLTNCGSGIHIGAQNVPGLYFSTLSNLYFSTNAGWGINLENFSEDHISHIFSVSNTVGDQRYASTVEQATYQPGNSLFEQLFSSPLNNNARGIVFEALGADASSQSGLNSLTGANIQVNRFRDSLSTQTITPAGGSSTSIAVTDLTQFAVGMPFWVTTSADGFTANLTYFVLTVSGASGSGTITAATTKYGTAIATSASTALTMKNYGMPCMEIVGNLSSASSKVGGSSLTGLDLEGGSTVGLFVGNGINLNLQVQVQALSQGPSGVVFRTSTSNIFNSVTAMTGDIDSGSVISYWNGSRSTMNQRNPPGVYTDTTLSVNGITLTNIAGNVPDLYVRSPTGGEFWYPNGVSMGEHIFSAAQGNSSQTLSAFYAGVLSFNGSSAQTFTLPTIDNGSTVATSILGIRFRIQNASQSNTLAIATSSSQTLNNISGKTTTTIAVNSVLDCIAASTAAAAILYWSCTYFAGSAIP